MRRLGAGLPIWKAAKCREFRSKRYWQKRAKSPASEGRPTSAIRPASTPPIRKRISLCTHIRRKTRRRVDHHHHARQARTGGLEGTIGSITTSKVARVSPFVVAGKGLGRLQL